MYFYRTVVHRLKMLSGWRAMTVALSKAPQCRTRVNQGVDYGVIPNCVTRRGGEDVNVRIATRRRA